MSKRIEQYLTEKRISVDKALREFMPAPEGFADNVIKAMNYTLLAGGKRIRPILCIAGAEAVGGSGDEIMPVACALELIHSYSLIHDDLPIMDNDDLRRGEPTNHKVFGEAIALLAGDGLLTLSFYLMAHSGRRGGVSERAVLRVIDVISSAAGYQGMVGGQAADITYEGIKPDPPVVEYIHSHKTAALIACSVEAGAILAGGSEEEIDSMRRYGKNIGIAFQVADDILNIEGTKEKMGKDVGSDMAKGKTTYPSVFGLKESKRIQSELIERAINNIKDFDDRAWPLREIARYIIERSS